MKWKLTLGLTLFSLAPLFAQTFERSTYSVFQPLGANDTVMVAAGQVIAGDGEAFVDHGYYPLQNTILSVEQTLSVVHSFLVYPNPFNDAFQIQIDLNSSEEYRVEMRDVSGAQVYNSSIQNGSTTISTNHLSAGIYTISVFSSEGMRLFSEKIIRQ